MSRNKDVISLDDLLSKGVKFKNVSLNRSLSFKTSDNYENNKANNRGNVEKYVCVEINCTNDGAKNSALYRYYGQDSFITLHFDLDIPSILIKKILKQGLLVHEYKQQSSEFAYFGQSASQLRSKTCILYNKTKLGDYEHVIGTFGNFKKINDVAKRSARIGLLLSSCNKCLSIGDANVEAITDIEHDGFNFTDGCGYISFDYLEDVARETNTCNSYEMYSHYKGPSVIQIRFKGCKGVLSASKSLVRKIQIRPSMEKFTWIMPEPYTLGIVEDGMSRPYTYGYLNKQYICVLSANAISDEVFLKKQQKYFHEIDNLVTNVHFAIRYLCFWARYDYAERLMKTQQIDKDIREFLEAKRMSLVKSQLENTKDKKKSQAEALKIPIEESRNVFGIADPSGLLQSGFAFFQPTVDGKVKDLHNTKIVVLKSPCYHPGDIKVLTCVNIPECRHLYDCLVFPTNGTRPHSDEIAGSDLDGDKYFVSWDQDLIPSQSVHNPTSYQGCKSKPSEVTYEKLIDFFANYNTTLVGKMSNLWSKWADLDGINTPECLLIANLFNRAIDSAKSGEKVDIPEVLKNVPETRRHSSTPPPVWLQMAINAKNYTNKILAENENPFETLRDEELVELVKNHEIRIDDYRLFRLLYLHLYKTNKQNLFKQLLDYISFDHFSEEQLKSIHLDCPNIVLEYFLNPMCRSKIIRKPFLSNLQLESRHNWSLYYSVDDGEHMDWDILNDFFMQSCNKMLFFQFDMGGIRRIIAISVNYPIKLNEYTEAAVENKCLSNVYIWIDDNIGTFYTKQIGKEFTWALDGRVLQLFIGKRGRTFVFLKEDEEEKTIMSVALNFFDRNLLEKYPRLRLQRDRLVRAEFYSDMGLKQPFLVKPCKRIVEEQNTSTTISVEKFNYAPADFPSIEESLLVDNKKQGNRRSQFLEIKDAIDEKLKNSKPIDQDLIIKCISMIDENDWLIYEIMRYLLYLLSRGHDLRDSFYYMKLLMRIIETTPSCLDLKGLWLENVQTVINSIRMHKVDITLVDIQTLLFKVIFTQTCRGSFALDFLNALKSNYFPLNDDNVKSEAHAYYYLYWAALLTSDLVYEIQEAEYKSKYLEAIAIADVLLSNEKIGEQHLWYVNLRDATLSFGITDVVALSACGEVYDPIVFCQIIKQTGQILTVQAIWPYGYEITEKMQCRADKFPSLITFKRQLDSLNLHVCKDNTNQLSNFVISSFYEQIKGAAVVDEFLNRKLNDKNAELIFMANANEAQKAAIGCLASQNIILVHGPPGTGKSEVACEIIAQWERIGNVLVVAETNEAVNNVLVKLKSKQFDLEKIIRIGARSKDSPAEIDDYTIEKKYKANYGERKNIEYMDKSKALRLVKNARVVFTTCSSSMIAFMLDTKFDFLIVDEAAQAFEPAVMMALTRNCEKMCLIGDPCQLPPLVKSPNIKNELSVTLFDRLSKIIEPVMLNVQFRMNPIISQFPSLEFYQGKLIDGVTANDRMGKGAFRWPNARKPLVFININSKEDGCGKSKSNKEEADFIKYLIDNSFSANVKELGIITPYKAQVELLEKLIGGNKSITIGTVDGFQGQEREVIIFSAVRANECGDVGFLNDKRRLNVSFTRAKSGLIVIGNERTLRNDPLWDKWLNWVRDNNLKMQLDDFCGSTNRKSSASSAVNRKSATRRKKKL